MFVASKDSEAQLIETVSKLRGESVSWRAIHFHFSKLMETYNSAYQIKIAVNLLKDLLNTLQGGVFVCFDNDIMVVCRAIQRPLLEKVVFQLRYLFMDDPLAYHGNGQENPSFCTVYDLSIRWEDFLNVCKTKMAQSTAVPPAPASIHDKGGRKVTRQFTPARLSSIERDLSRADLSQVLRRQPVCAAVGDRKVKRIFDEMYINISHLRQLLMADVDLTSNRWLFQYLTQLLDMRILDIIQRRPGYYLQSPISLNLNVATLLSERFAEFDATIKPDTKVSLVLEIHIMDVFADMRAFQAARESVQKLGYRVCVDGLSTRSFEQIDRHMLGFDLAKVQWNADIAVDFRTRKSRQMAEAVNRCGPNRVILCRCDTAHAIDYGHSFGISLFQGRYLDKLLDPKATIEN